MNQKRNKFYVYGLICPIDNVIKYIGASINPDLRYKKHLRNTDGTIDKIKWISNLIDSGKKPSMIILGEFTNEKECADAENSLCKKYSSNLLNDNIDKNRYKIGSKSDVTNNKASNSLEKFINENKLEENENMFVEVHYLKPKNTDQSKPEKFIQYLKRKPLNRGFNLIQNFLCNIFLQNNLRDLYFQNLPIQHYRH